MFNRMVYKIFSLALLLTSLLMACQTDQVATPDANPPNTLAAPTNTPMSATPTSRSPTATAVPSTMTPLPPTATPIPLPTETAVALTPTTAPGDQLSVTEYFKTVAPLFTEAETLARRDLPLLVKGKIIPSDLFNEMLTELEAAGWENLVVDASERDPAAVCGGELTPHPILLADAARLNELYHEMDAITAPPGMADCTHKPLTETAHLWGKALDTINLSCQTAEMAERENLRLRALLELGGASANYVFAARYAVRCGFIAAAEDVAAAQGNSGGMAACADASTYYSGADLSDAYLDGEDLSACLLMGANLQGADLANADLSGTNLTAANLVNANLESANLSQALLVNADLTAVNLTNAILVEVDLTNANLTDAVLDNAIWENTICPDGSNTDSNGLDGC